MSRRRAGRMSVYAGLAVILAAALFPLWWMIVTSLKRPVDIFAGVALWPQKLTGSNYDVLFEQHHFRSFLVNSIAIVAVAVLARLVLGTLAAYSLTRFRLRLGLNQSALVVALLIRMIPGILLVIPLYIVLSKNGLLDTRLGLILVYSGLNTSFVIWMMQSFLQEIPRDIEEAALVDGDSRLTALRRIVLRTIDAIGTFDQIFVLTRGGPGASTQLIAIYGYKTGFLFSQYGQAAAMLLALLAFTLLLMVVAIRSMRRASAAGAAT